MRLFKRRTETVEVAAAHCYARSWYGVTFHAREVATSNRAALCGYDTLDDGGPVTPEDWASAMDRQHENFRLCKECGTALLGPPAAE